MHKTALILVLTLLATPALAHEGHRHHRNHHECHPVATKINMSKMLQAEDKLKNPDPTKERKLYEGPSLWGDLFTVADFTFPE